MFRLVLDIVAGGVKNKASTAGIIIMRVQPHAHDVTTNKCVHDDVCRRKAAEESAYRHEMHKRVLLT